jgi:hypothetical protein
MGDVDSILERLKDDGLIYADPVCRDILAGS